MTQFAQAFGNKFNKDDLRIRSFEMNGHTFKVKVPLTSEYESLLDSVQIVDDAKVAKYYETLSSEFIKNKDKFKEEDGVEYQDNDVLIKGASLQETAKNKVIMENRITGLFKLLVPEEQGFDMSTITYEMIEELFPFPVQLQIMEEINSVISPNYKESKGK